MGKIKSYVFAAALFYSVNSGNGLESLHYRAARKVEPLKMEELLRDLGKHEPMLWGREFRVYLGDEGKVMGA